MMEHRRGITLQQVAIKLRQVMEINIKQLFEERRSPDLVGSKLLYLSTWRDCLNLCNPDGVPNFPLAKELESESADQSADQSVCLRTPSTEDRAYHDRQILEERQHAAKQEWQVIKRKIVEDIPPPVGTQIPGHKIPKPSANQPRPSTTLAFPAVAKPQDNYVPNPSANQPAASTSLPSPTVTKPQSNDTPKPSINKAGVSSKTSSPPVVTKPPGTDTPQQNPINQPSPHNTRSPWPFGIPFAFGGMAG
ncbi:hypothetical protein B0T18DRAFT_420297 [Schizothecium vesticola]|uniref:Uncharacterized protein n=1 Tax=Schizothecium vesticola TaxID=314040 RepID=A0AA40K0K7_9PEZI|nr:hypothetical protein B0T18DRAFT_420297 [Schizothecium vesticola]